MNREQLLERQYQLLSCLVAAGPDPEGMPARRLRIVSRGLACKRRREALSSWPGLARLAGQVEPWFDLYAATHQRPAGGSPLLDGYQFNLWLARRGVAVAIRTVCECRPYRQSVVPRPAWQRHLLSLRYGLKEWWRRQSPEDTLKISLPTPV
ncbi:MAG: hypothetical protein KF760_13225 [Candidatus Eremiobacteraeota bacterium]|nr:hypothetical protein [Candidatus Eremiobacteraeota bacterium]MCW5867028.1 hypothetical protein [Candidatus Eremiobacteraeota bacterium]